MSPRRLTPIQRDHWVKLYTKAIDNASSERELLLAYTMLIRMQSKAKRE